MTENGRKFLEALSEHDELREKINQVKTKEEVRGIAAELGITLDAADFIGKDGQELSDEELAAVAGGNCIIFGSMHDGYCGCALFGAGEKGFCLGYGEAW